MEDIRLHRAQSEVINDLFGPNPDYKMRFEVVVGSRGLGKSYLAAAAALLATAELESMPSSVPNKNVTLICGTHTQVLDVYVPLLNYTFGLDQLSYKHSASQGRWYLPNGSMVTCRSAEAIERLRGTGQYLVIVDEMPTYTIPNASHESAWEAVIAPTITTRWSPERARAVGAPSPGRGLLIASPLYKDYFYELSQKEVVDDRWKTRHYTYRDSPLLDRKEIEQEKRSMDKYRFAREYEASFEDAGARVFFSFERKKHVKVDLEPIEKNETVHVSIDFNVMKNCSAFHVVRGGQIFTFDESEGTANTEELAKLIKSKFPSNKVVCYPDPSGRARKTSSPVGQTDFSILRDSGFEVLARPKAPPIVDSVNAVNRLFENANGEANWFVTPNCSGFIKSMERTVWLENRPDSAMIDKTMDVEHFGDGARYFAEYMFPVQNHVTRAKRGFAF
jgi:hypothetical protein